jgi:uncharacterized protein
MVVKLEPKTLKKFLNLKDKLKDLDRVIIAYSGGIDSSVLLRAACDVLGNNNVIAATADSQTYTKKELIEAKKFAKSLKVRHIIIKTDELKDPRFVNNPLKRCYWCKQELFVKIKKAGVKFNIKHILDGANYNDLSDWRPGIKAAEEMGVSHPLLESKITKEDIRHIAKYLKISFFDKPASACLASRIPFGQSINEEILLRIEKAEDFLRKNTFKILRVRVQGENFARIEVGNNEFAKFADPSLRDRIIKKFKSLQFKYITIDLEGYRQGSFNP